MTLGFAFPWIKALISSVLLALVQSVAQVLRKSVALAATFDRGANGAKQLQSFPDRKCVRSHVVVDGYAFDVLHDQIVRAVHREHPGHPERGFGMGFQRVVGDYAGAERYARQALDLRRKLPSLSTQVRK